MSTPSTRNALDRDRNWWPGRSSDAPVDHAGANGGREPEPPSTRAWPSIASPIALGIAHAIEAIERERFDAEARVVAARSSCARATRNAPLLLQHPQVDEAIVEDRKMALCGKPSPVSISAKRCHARAPGAAVPSIASHRLHMHLKSHAREIHSLVEALEALAVVARSPFDVPIHMRPSGAPPATSHSCEGSPSAVVYGSLARLPARQFGVGTEPHAAIAARQHRPDLPSASFLRCRHGLHRPSTMRPTPHRSCRSKAFGGIGGQRQQRSLAAVAPCSLPHLAIAEKIGGHRWWQSRRRHRRSAAGRARTRPTGPDEH